MKKIIGLLAFCSAVALVSSPAHALVTVAAGGGADYATIQEGLDAAAPGEEVQVTDQGTYAEALNINGEVLTSVPAGATINADGNGAIIWGDANATIDGFNIIATANGVHIDGSPTDVQIMNCTFSCPTGVNFGAGVATATITNCTINAGAHGVLFNDGEGHTCNIDGCTITAAGEHAVTLYRSATVTITDSFLNNCGQSGIRVDGSSGVPDRVITVTNTQIMNNRFCNGIFRKGVYTFTDCRIEGNGEFGPDANWQGNFFVDGVANASTFNFTRTTLNDSFNRGLFTGRPITLNMTDCEIKGNAGWGILIDVYDGDETNGITENFDGCTFTNNGGIDIYLLAKGADTTATITDCTFSGNALHINSEANNSPSGKLIYATIERNKLFDGSANATSQMSLTFLGAGSKVVNNLIDQGAATYIANSAVDVYHNTFVGTADGDGLNVEGLNDKAVNIKNNIIAGFDTGIITDGAGLANLSIQNNLIQAVTAEGDATIAPLLDATNILGLSPEFVSASDIAGVGDYHLNGNSPALGRGADLSVSDDLDAGARPLPAGSAPDLGAYEHTDVPVELSNFMID